MAEYIDREAVERLASDVCEECREACLKFDGIYADCHQCLFERVKDGVPKIPAADVAPVRHGHWFESSMSFTDGLTRLYGYKCSECSGFCVGESRYCPNCGARMDGDT